MDGLRTIRTICLPRMLDPSLVGYLFRRCFKTGLTANACFTASLFALSATMWISSVDSRLDHSTFPLCAHSGQVVRFGILASSCFSTVADLWTEEGANLCRNVRPLSGLYRSRPTQGASLPCMPLPAKDQRLPPQVRSSIPMVQSPGIETPDQFNPYRDFVSKSYLWLRSYLFSVNRLFLPVCLARNA